MEGIRSPPGSKKRSEGFPADRCPRVGCARSTGRNGRATAGNRRADLVRNFLRAVVVLAVLGIPSQALAAPAAIDHVTTFATGSFAVDDFFCLGPAVMTGTDTLRYETVETSRGFHVEGLDMGGFTAEIEGGATAVGGSNDRFAFNT